MQIYYTLSSIEGITIAIFFGGVGIPPLVELLILLGPSQFGMAIAST
ncbi:MAG: hypothetical protein ACRD6U_09770 [Nitrososphaeraceae archaeon]|jgi:hypothetical protein